MEEKENTQNGYKIFANEVSHKEIISKTLK